MNPVFWSAICKKMGWSFQHFQEHLGRSEFSLLRDVPNMAQLSRESWSDTWSFLKHQLLQVEPTQVLYPGHMHYPPCFLKLPQPPVFLHWQGRALWESMPGLAVVGTRQPDPVFKDWMDTEFSSFLRLQDLFVVSGGARGIDQKSELVALRNERPCLVFLPSGLEFHRQICRRSSLWAQSLVYMTEYLPGEPIQRHHFVERNRLIAAMGEAVLAVQFAVKSGTMITVKSAIDQNKEVWTLPDHPMNARSSGNVQLLKEGATLVSQQEDLQLQWGLLQRRLGGENLFSPGPEGDQSENKIGSPKSQ